jgi:methylmalonyl-CoA/ethylmalonyl-CoA epimerase
VIQAVGQVAIPSGELDASIAFYRDVLGVPFLFRAGELAFFQCGEVRLMLTAEGAGASSIVYYRVEDVRAAYDALKAKEAPLVDEPHLIARLPDREVWMFFLRDPSGNTLGVMAEPRI